MNSKKIAVLSPDNITGILKINIEKQNIKEFFNLLILINLNCKKI
tara:strand:- start:337 stop:471 length:135 start_codon:yes stop_codon:yes gene_type:complete